MQSVKFVMREVGLPGMSRISAEEFEEYLQYQFLSQGYRVFSQHNDPIMNGTDFLGYRVFMTLVKDEEPKAAKVK